MTTGPCELSLSYRFGGSLSLVLALSTVLHGCSEGEDKDCPAWYDPLVKDFVPDFSELVDDTGCEPWDFWHGTSCASDMPVVGALQGFWSYDKAADYDSVLGSLRNGIGQCLMANTAGSCTYWNFSKWGCEEDSYEECECTQTSGGVSDFCMSWRCVVLTVEHFTCWEHEWEATWQKACTPKGSYPFYLNSKSARGLWHSVLMGSMMGSSSNALNGVIESFTIPRTEDQQGYETQGECFVFREPTTGSSMPSRACQNNGWRLARNMLKTCTCARLREDELACEQWHCIEKLNPDNGGWANEPAGEHDYVCMEQEPSPQGSANNDKELGPGVQCGAWHGRQKGLMVTEVTECRAACLANVTGRECGDWACTFYGLPNMARKYEGQDYGNRWGIGFAHCAWLSPVYFFANFIFVSPFFARFGSLDHWGPAHLVPAAIAGVIAYLCLTWMLYLIMFYRVVDSHTVPLTGEYAWGNYDRWGPRAPLGPGLGLFAMSAVSWFSTAATSCRWSVNEKKSSTTACLSAVFGTCAMVVLVFFWKCGFFGALPFLALATVVLGLLIMSRRGNFGVAPVPEFEVTAAVQYEGAPIVAGHAESAVVWEYEWKGNYTPFAEDCQAYIEKKYKEYTFGGEKRVNVRTRGTEVSLDFEILTSKLKGKSICSIRRSA